MTYEELVASLEADAPPAGATAIEQALWHQQKSNWDTAHDLLQPYQTGDGAWVHALLHREEGDLGNAGYWYRNAGQPVPPKGTSLDDEWHQIAKAILG